MKRVLLVLALASLALPANAAAKGEITSAQVCGASGCVTVDRPSQALSGGGDGIPELAPAVEPYYTVQLTVEHGEGSDSWQIFYLPGSAMAAFPGEHDDMIFEQLPAAAAVAFRNAARGVEPYRAPTITGGTVGGRQVADPASYLTLFGLDGGGDVYPAEPDFVPILLQSTRPSPWTSAGYFLFSPSAGALMRAGAVVKLPDAVAASIAARQSLAAGDSAGRAGFDWTLVSIVLAATLALALVGLALVRRLHRPATV